MWIFPDHISGVLDWYFLVVGRALFICQKFEQLLSRYSVVSEWKDVRDKGRKNYVEKAWEIHSKRTLHQKLSKLEKFLEDDMDSDIYHKAREARNYIAHESISFAEGCGTPDIPDADVIKYINESIPKLKQAVFEVLCAEEDLNYQDWFINYKDSSPPFISVNYKERVMNWVFRELSCVDEGVE